MVKMNIYIVKGRVEIYGYRENLVILENMDEKPKSFVGYGKRVDKSKIGRLEQGAFVGSYQIVLTDKDEIPMARKKIKEKIYEDKKKELDILKEEIKRLDEHNLDSEIKIHYISE